MLFSHPQVAELMSKSFECAWESARPVPRVSIDFGNGHTLERTLHGNIVTYLCTSAGEVFDLVPGLVDAREYVRRLDQAVRLNWNRGWLRMNHPSPAGQPTPLVLGDALPTAASDPWRDVVTRWHEAMVARTQAGEDVGEPIRIFDGSKMRVELMIDESLLPKLARADAEALRLDTLHNRKHRYPLASQVLLEHPFSKPAAIGREVYRRVLGVDLEDPYLGLAPDVLGGELGRN